MKKQLLFIHALLLVLFAGCRKLEDRHFSTDLAVDSRIVRVAADADTTRIIVYAEGDWRMEPAEKVSWARLTNDRGSGKGQVIVQLDNNTGNLPRAVMLYVKANGKTDSISLQQRGLVPALAITDTTAISIANGGSLKTVINTNVPMELMKVSYRFLTEGQQNWLSDLSIKDGYLYFKADTNRSAEARSAIMKLSYLDALGTTTTDSIIVRQHPGMDYSGALLKDFAYVKQLLATGAITENIYVEGIVVSDKGHPNIAKNLNTAANKHVLDKTENAIAVYVQSADGNSGIYFKTKTAGDNIFNFNDRVKIWLKGATLDRLANPDRVIVTGIEAKQIMAKEAGNMPLIPKEKYIADLTDNDLYTYVKLKDVEISVPDGAFTNINEGYIARMDCYPTSIRDIKGNSMYLLTNLDVAYRRDGQRVPQGSGNISGIIVYETMDRFGGNIGRYAIRHLQRSDIALAEDRNNSFSNTLVEWSRFKTEFAATPTPAANPMTPDVGAGNISHSAKAAMDFTANGIYTTNDYNGLLQEATTNKGSVSNGGWGAKNWWNTTANRGEYWLIEVSTAGITTPVSLQLDGNTDIGGPRNFVVEWASTNTGTTTWQTAGTFTFEDVANWTSTLLTQVAGYKAVNIAFPAGASNLEKLYIRIRVANRTVGTSTAATGGTLGATTACRLGHLSIRYNK